MRTYKVAELEGALLDAAVAKALGDPRISLWGDSPWIEDGDWNRAGQGRGYAPSTDWRDGGPLVERLSDLHRVPKPDLYNEWGDQPPWRERWEARCGMQKMQGPTPLVAAMRAFCASRVGETVDLP
jgi:hypothetical protein